MNRPLVIRPPWPFHLNRASPQARGLLAWWPMFRSGERMIDLAGRGLHAELIDSDYKPAPFGGLALNLSGASSEAEIGTPSVLNFDSSDAFTLTAWVRRNDPTNPDPILFNLDTSDIFTLNGYHIGWLFGIFAVFLISELSNLDYIEVNADDSDSETDWIHIAVTYDGSSLASGLTLYKNGKPRSASAAWDGLTGSMQSSAPLHLGGSYQPGFNFSGELLDVRIYGRKFGEREIWAIYDPRTRWQLYEPFEHAAYLASILFLPSFEIPLWLTYEGMLEVPLTQEKRLSLRLASDNALTLTLTS